MRLLSIVVLICLSLTGGASAYTEFGVYGGTGAKEDADVCKPGSFMVGLVGNVGSWIDQITVLCGQQRSDGSIGPPNSLISRGGGGGTFLQVTCGADEVVSGIFMGRTPNYQIRFVRLTCSNVKTSASHTNMFSPQGTGPGGAVDYESAGSVQNCKSGEFASGLRIRYGQYVNALGLICGDYRPVAPPPAASLPPVSTAPIGTTADYAGRWRMRTVQNADFTLTLNVSGDSVTGQFINSANGTYNGTLSGAVKNGRLRYTWSQPAMNATGDGIFDVHTDNTLHGGMTYKAPGAAKPTYYRWAGTRLSGGVATAPVNSQKTSTATEPTDIWDKPGGTGAGAKETGKSLAKDQTIAFIGCVQAHPGWAEVAGGFVWGEHIKPGC